MTRNQYEQAYKNKIIQLKHLCDGHENLDFWEEFEKTSTPEEIIGQWLVDEGNNALMFYRRWNMPEGVDFETLPHDYLFFDRELSRFCKDKIVNKYIGIAKRMKNKGKCLSYLLGQADVWFENSKKGIIHDDMVEYQWWLICKGIKELYSVN